MAFTTEGWTIWSRAAGTQTVSSGDSVATIQALVAANPTDEIRFASGTTNAQIQTVLTAGTNPVAFVCGGTWNDVSLLDKKGRDYYAWYGTPSNGRPKLNVVSPDNSTGLKIEPGNADFDIKIIGLEFDGRRTGDAGDNWYGEDRDLIWVNINDNQDGSCELLIEDCYLHHCDTCARLIDNHARFAAVSNEDVFHVVGGITGSMRRNLLRYATSLDSHAILLYTEGLGDGFTVEQCSFDKGGYFNSRNEDDPRGVVNGKIARNAGKEEHAHYNQRFGRPVISRENYYSNIAANTLQSRPGGTYNYNVASRTGMLFTSLNQTGTCIGNVFADREDISTTELRGIGLQIYRGTGGTGTGNHTINENIFYRPRFSSKKQRVIETFGATVTARNNVAVNWGVLESESGNGVFEIDGNEGLGSNGNSRLSTGLARGYNDLGWPEDTEAEITTRFSRGLGQWRPTTDHPGAFINEVRALAEAATEATLPQLAFANNGATSVGNGGLGGSPTTSLPTAYVVESEIAINASQGVVLNGYAADTDGQALTYQWSTVSGPDSPTFLFGDQPIAYVSQLSVGEYVFRLTVTNEDENSDTADITVTVTAAPETIPVDPPATPDPVDPTDQLADIEHAIANSEGTVDFADGTVRTSQLDIDTEAHLVLESGAVIKRLPDSPGDYATSTTCAISFETGSADSSLTGGTIDANGAYSGVWVGQNVTGIGITNVHAQNAAYKCFLIQGDATLTNCSASSTVSGGDPARRSLGLQIDPGSQQAGEVVVNGFTFGSFVDSTEGQTGKLAATDTIRLSGILTPEVDDDTTYSMSIAQDLGYVIIKNSDLPREVAHFPDTGEASVGTLVYSGVTFGRSGVTSAFRINHQQAKTVVYNNCDFYNSPSVCINDETPAAELSLRIFIDCRFHTPAGESADLITHDDGDSVLTGRVIHAGCTFTGTWTKPDDWDTSEITLPTGYKLSSVVEAFL